VTYRYIPQEIRENLITGTNLTLSDWGGGFLEGEYQEEVIIIIIIIMRNFLKWPK